jgi:hypothetical protein
MRMCRNRWFLAVTTAATLVLPAPAEKVNLSPQELRDTATHVLRGRVNAVYARTEAGGDWRYTVRVR